jgi:hypothetical protein
LIDEYSLAVVIRQHNGKFSSFLFNLAYLSSLAVRRARPFFLRRDISFLPPFFFMRLLKPVVFFRLRLLG